MEETVITDTLIIGAGISGLASAHFLKKSGADVRIIEKKPRAGGSIQSEHKDGFLVDHGPNSALETTPLLKEIFEDTGIIDEMIYANDSAKNRYILKNGKLQALPMSPVKFMKTKLFSFPAKMRLFKEPFIKPYAGDDDESLADFVKRRLGKEFLFYAIDPFVAGIFAGTPENLSTKSAFPKLHQLEQEYGSLIRGALLGARKRKKSKEKSKQSAKMFSFVNGMETMIKALADEFKDVLHLNCIIKSIEKQSGKWQVEVDENGEKKIFQAKSVLFTIPAHAYENIPFARELQDQFDKFYYPPVTMVFYGYRKNPSKAPLDGFGYLIPRKEEKNILGTIWSSVIFPGRAPEGGAAFTTFVGGSRQPENAQKTEEEIDELVRSDFKSIMGIDAEPDVKVIHKWNKAIPQYKVNHYRIIEEIEKFEYENAGIFIAGNFRGGISVADCVKQSKENEEKIGEFLNTEK